MAIMSALIGDLFITGIMPPIQQLNNSAAELGTPGLRGVDNVM